MARQFFVGGNFKMNPASKEQKVALVKVLNEATIDPSTGLFLECDLRHSHLNGSVSTEVVIAPPALYLIPVKELVRKEIKVAAQNCYFKGAGAFTGEIRCVLL